MAGDTAPGKKYSGKTMLNNLSKKIIFVVLVVALTSGGFYAGIRYQQFQSPNLPEGPATEIINRANGQPVSVDFSLFWKVLDRLEKRYVDQDKLIDKRELVYGAIEGMVNALGDPYTVFLKPVESKKFEEQIKGSFGGVGIEIGMRKEVLTVIAPIKNTPAEKAGIQAGDLIIKIDDQDSTGLSIDEAVTKIRGKKGTAVKLTIARTSLKEPKDFSIVRDEIKIPTVEWKLIENTAGRKNIAHLQLFVFNRNVDTEFNKIVKEILSSEAESIVLDLRNNPGGLLDSSINIASTFLSPDQVVVSERFADKTETVLKTVNGSPLKKYPLVILINKGSASASEILAGALRDNRQIKIIGETSFGKGSVQELLDFPESSERATLKVTIAKWYTPSGVSISDEGIKPDIEVKRTEEDIENNRDPQLEKAVELLGQ